MSLVLLAVYLGFTWCRRCSRARARIAASLSNHGTFKSCGVVGAIGGLAAIARIGSRITMIAMGGGPRIVVGHLHSRNDDRRGQPTFPIVWMLALTGGLINAVQTTLYALAAHFKSDSAPFDGRGSAAARARLGAILSSLPGLGRSMPRAAVASSNRRRRGDERHGHLARACPAATYP
jgi:AAHS family 4-hydroxybenzoate transporter-like MFS transporter